MTRRSKAEWLRLIESHKTSGLSAAEFCRRNKLDAKYFSLRRRELTGSKTSTAFINIAPPSDTVSQTRLRVVEVDIPSDQLPTVLSQLLR